MTSQVNSVSINQRTKDFFINFESKNLQDVNNLLVSLEKVPQLETPAKVNLELQNRCYKADKEWDPHQKAAIIITGDKLEFYQKWNFETNQAEVDIKGITAKVLGAMGSALLGFATACLVFSMSINPIALIALFVIGAIAVIGGIVIESLREERADFLVLLGTIGIALLIPFAA